MPMSIYVVSIGYNPQHRRVKRMCSNLPKFITRHIRSETLYTCHPEQHIRHLDPPLYDALLPPPYTCNSQAWANDLAAKWEVRGPAEKQEPEHRRTASDHVSERETSAPSEQTQEEDIFYELE